MWPTIYFILALGGLVLLLVALFGDRPRGRRRCPKCFYRIATQPPKDGSAWRCSECGREIRSERHLRRTRRHWWWAFAGLAIFLAAWIYPKREEFQQFGWRAAVPTVVLLPILDKLDRDWRNIASISWGGPFDGEASLLLWRSRKDRLSWLDWQLLLWRIESGDPSCLYAYPERHNRLEMTLCGELLQVAQETGRLAQARINRLDALLRVDVDPVETWVVGEPLPARLHVRDWRPRLTAVDVSDCDGAIWITGLRFGPAGEGGGISGDYHTWSDRFVELPPVDSEGEGSVQFSIRQRPSPLSKRGSIFGSASRDEATPTTMSDGEENLYACEQSERISVQVVPPQHGLPAEKRDASIDTMIRQLQPTLKGSEADARFQANIIGNVEGPLLWVDVSCRAIEEITRSNEDMVLALRIELWHRDQFVGHASAWWGLTAWDMGTGGIQRSPAPIMTEYVERHRVQFKQALERSDVLPLDLSECRWRILPDPLMVRRALAWSARDNWPLCARMYEWTSYWDGEVIIDAGGEQTPPP